MIFLTTSPEPWYDLFICANYFLLLALKNFAEIRISDSG